MLMPCWRAFGPFGAFGPFAFADFSDFSESESEPERKAWQPMSKGRKKRNQKQGPKMDKHKPTDNSIDIHDVCWTSGVLDLKEDEDLSQFGTKIERSRWQNVVTNFTNLKSKLHEPTILSSLILTGKNHHCLGETNDYEVQAVMVSSVAFLVFLGTLINASIEPLDFWGFNVETSNLRSKPAVKKVYAQWRPRLRLRLRLAFLLGLIIDLPVVSWDYTQGFPCVASSKPRSWFSSIPKVVACNITTIVDNIALFQSVKTSKDSALHFVFRCIKWWWSSAD